MVVYLQLLFSAVLGDSATLRLLGEKPFLLAVPAVEDEEDWGADQKYEWQEYKVAYS